MSNPSYLRFSEDLSSGLSGQHSTMTEPDFTKMELPGMWNHQEQTEQGDGYESEEYYDEQGRKVQQTFYDDGNSSLFDEQSDDDMDGGDFFEETGHRRGRNYSREDMTPTVRDPLCGSKTDLAYLWPVYVSNFRCAESGKLLNSVKSYFVSKGLHARWHYRPVGGPFNDLQQTIGIYDMLVYFVSKYDACLALERCHRDVFRGYTLNVFPGRVPIYFDPDRSVRVWKKSRGVAYSEQFFEKIVQKVVPMPVISCTVKFDIMKGIMEFGSREDMTRAMATPKRFNWEPVSEPFQKQRFLENDLLREMELQLAPNPYALRLDLNDKYAQKLCKDIRPRKPKKRYYRHDKWERYGKQKRYILKMLSQGRKPKCYFSDDRRRDVFFYIVRRMKKRLASAAKKNKGKK